MSAKHLIVLTMPDTVFELKEDEIKILADGFNAVLLICYSPEQEGQQVEIFDNPELEPVNSDNFLAVISKLNLKKPRVFLL